MVQKITGNIFHIKMIRIVPNRGPVQYVVPGHWFNDRGLFHVIVLCTFKAHTCHCHFWNVSTIVFPFKQSINCSCVQVKNTLDRMLNVSVRDQNWFYSSCFVIPNVFSTRLRLLHNSDLSSSTEVFCLLGKQVVMTKSEPIMMRRSLPPYVFCLECCNG